MADCVDPRFSKPVNNLLELAATGSEKEPDWTLLPDVVLTYIFGCLPDVDRHSMALVCVRWSRIFSSACLWRYRCFRFGGLRSGGDEARRAVAFTRQQGHALRYLTFVCKRPDISLCKIFQKTITECFSTLACRLHTFIMSELCIDSYWRYKITREPLVEALTLFLKLQTALELFDMSYAKFSKKDGFKVS